MMEFIFSEQDWKDKDGKVVVTHIEVMESNGYAHCRVSLYQTRMLKFYPMYMWKTDAVAQVFVPRCSMLSNVYLNALIP